MPRTRRSLLAGGAALVAAAGCLGRTSPGAGTDGTTTDSTTTTESPTDETSTQSTTGSAPTLAFGETGSVGDLAVTPTGAATQSSVFYLQTADQMGVIDPDGRRLLFVDVSLEGGGPEPSAFQLQAGEETVEGWTQFSGERGYQLAPHDRRGEQYRPDEPVGWIGFDVPVGVETAAARITLDREGSPAWQLPAAAGSRLQAGEPVFELQSLSVPDRVEDPSSIPFSVTARNRGSAAGTFRFVVNFRGPTYAPDRHRVELSAGETRTYETTVDPYGAGDADAIDLAVTTADGSQEFSIHVA